jgi:hypothetical protein
MGPSSRPGFTDRAEICRIDGLLNHQKISPREASHPEMIQDEQDLTIDIRQSGQSGLGTRRWTDTGRVAKQPLVG